MLEGSLYQIFLDLQRWHPIYSRLLLLIDNLCGRELESLKLGIRKATSEGKISQFLNSTDNAFCLANHNLSLQSIIERLTVCQPVINLNTVAAEHSRVNVKLCVTIGIKQQLTVMQAWIHLLME